MKEKYNFKLDLELIASDRLRYKLKIDYYIYSDKECTKLLDQLSKKIDYHPYLLINNISEEISFESKKLNKKMYAILNVEHKEQILKTLLDTRPDVIDFIKTAYKKRDKYLTPYINITNKHIKYIHKLEIKDIIALYNYNEGYFYNSGVIEQFEEKNKQISIYKYKKSKKSKNIFNEKYIFINYKKSIREYKLESILNTIKNAPKYNKTFKIYRGININHKLINKDKLFGCPTLNGCSLIPYVSLKFISRCCMFEITVDKNSNYIFLNDKFDEFGVWEEYEVLLQPCFLKINEIRHLLDKDFEDYFPDNELVGWFVSYKHYDELKKNGIYLYKCTIINGDISYDNTGITLKEI